MRGNSVSVAVLGCGTVGSGLIRVVSENAREITTRIGAPVHLHSIVVRDPSKPRDEWVPSALVTADAEAAITDPSVDVVVECIGGTGVARDLVTRALAAGKHVATANKELIAKHGRELAALAEESNVDLRFEASVAGGIPIIRALRTSLAADRVWRVMGIVNGTTNYILTRMTRAKVDFSEALAGAQALGFAEPDPTNDVDGFDAACKLTILATLAFGKWVDFDSVQYEGIRGVSALDIEMAARFGYVIKLLAVGRRDITDRIELRVHPTLVPQAHPLASVSEEFNAVFVNAVHSRELMFYGPGAGAGPTGSALAGDVLDIARDIIAGTGASAPLAVSDRPQVVPRDEVESRYYLRMIVPDSPGAIGSVAQVLGRNQVSIAACHADRLEGGTGCTVWITHPVVESSIQTALEAIRGLGPIYEIASAIRIEE